MKISGSTPNYIQQTYTTPNQSNQAAASQAATAATVDEAKTDSINLSATTRDLQKISQAMDTEPADRQQRVAELREQVQANQYTVNAEQVAEKMVGSIMHELG